MDDDADLAFAVDYDYEATGEVSSITQLVTSAVSTYGYGDAQHPNAVTSVTTGTAVDAFTYDEAGRMVSRAVAGQAATALTWDASSNLVATSGQGGDRVYLYDALGQRIAQVSVGDLDAPTPVSATVYFGATEATDPDTDPESPDDVSATRFYSLGGSTVATATAETGSAPQWALLFGDIQGSASVSMELVADTTTATGFEFASITHEVVRDAYMPYGAARGDGATTDDLSIDRGWLGQYEDSDTGLTYLNARYYDPMLGRFLSPDPLMNPGDPRTLDPYRYADNNPISYVDNTGLCSGLSGDAIKKCALAYASSAANTAKSIAAGQAKVAEGKAKTNTTPPSKPVVPSSPPSAPSPAAPQGALPEWWDTPLRDYFSPEQLEMLDDASPADQERYIKVWTWNQALRETYARDYPDKTGWINASIHKTMYDFGYSVESEEFEFELQDYHYRLWRAGAKEATGQAPMAGLKLAGESLKKTTEIAASAYYGGKIFKPGFQVAINAQWVRDGYTIGDTLINFGDLGKVDDFSFPFYME